MSFTYDVSTSAGLVRLITTDSDAATAIFADAEIDAFLALHSGNVLLAAAQALDTIASSEALVQKKIHLLDLQTDGPAVAKALRDHAATLRKQAEDEAAAADVDGAFDIAEMVFEPFGTREALYNAALRGF